MKPNWLVYEDAARRVLNDIYEVLGITTVEGKQVVAGESSANWELDAKAWCKGGENFLVVEVRRHTSSGLKQEDVAAVAYRVKDTGAVGGIVVTPLPLQAGAQRVADHEGIAHVRLSPESTNETYLAEFMGRRFVGVSVAESVSLTDSADAVVSRGTLDGPQSSH